MYQHLKKLGKITQNLTAMPEKINQKDYYLVLPDR